MTQLVSTIPSDVDPDCTVTCRCTASVAAPELQAQLAQLRGCLEALARSEGMPDRQLLDAAQVAGDGMQALMAVLATLRATDRSAQRGPAAIGPIVAAVQEVLAGDLARHQVHVEVGPMPTIPVDPQQLYQALLVLFRHAARVAPRDALLRLQAERRPEVWQMRLGMEVDAANPGGGGHDLLPDGIELLLVQRIASAHGGSVTRDPGSTEGAAIRLSLRDFDARDGTFDPKTPPQVG